MKIKDLFRKEKILVKEKLPSMGYFYKDDFEIRIKKASDGDIISYENNFKIDNISDIIHKIKKIIKNNITFSNGYDFDDLISVDIIYIFLEIVKFTKNKKIKLYYVDIEDLSSKSIEFSSKNFNYLNIDDKVMNKYDSENKVFDIYNYKYSLPKIGIENSLNDFLVMKTLKGEGDRYSNLFYDFTHFSSHKKKLTFNEIDNLIQIFNNDIEESEFKKIKEILNIFKDFQKYSLIDNGCEVLEINGKINLEKIWK